MADDKLSLEIEIIGDDAVRSAKRTKSATDSMLESLQRAKRMSGASAIRPPLQAPARPPPRVLPPIAPLPARSAVDQLRTAVADVASGTTGNAQILADMRKRAEAEERLTAQARKLGLTEKVAAEYVTRAIQSEEAAAKNAASSIAGRLSALGGAARRARTAIGGELRGVGKEVDALLAPLTSRVRSATAPIGRAFSSIATRATSAMGRASAAVNRALSPITSRVGAVASAVGSRFRSMVSRVGSALAPLGKRLSSLASTTSSSLGSVASKLGSVFSALGPAIGAVAPYAMAAIGGIGAAVAGVTLAVGALTAAIVKFGYAAGQAAIEAQSSIMSIQRLMEGSTPAQASAQFDEVRYLAQQLGLDVGQTVSSFQALLRMKFDPQIAKDIIKMGADLQSVGVHADEVQGVITAMSQIKAKGRLQAEELMQLQERGVSGELVQEALMKRLGITDRDKYQKMLSGGKISAAVALTAIRDAIMAKTNESNVGEAGAGYANNTIKGQLNQMKAGWQNMLIDAGKLELPGIQKIVTTARGMFSAISNSPETKAFGASLLGAFDKFAAWFESSGPMIVDAAETMFRMLRPAIDDVGAAFDWLRENEDMVNTALQLTAVAVSGLVGASVEMVLWLGYAAAAGNLMAQAIYDAGARIYETASGWGASAYEWGASIVQGIVNGISDGVDSVRGAALNVWHAISGAFTGAQGADIHSPSRKTWAWGGQLDAGVSGGIMASLHMVRGASLAMAGAALPPSVPANSNSPRIRIASSKGDDEPSFDFDRGGKGGAGGGPVFHLHLTVEVKPGATREDGEAFGEGVGDGIERKLMALFSGTALTWT